MTAYRKINCVNHSLEEIMPIVSLNESGAYVLSLPSFLRPEQKN